uniref:MAM domain-containing protein n=1 Tax=Macrostomum lignano TaxID=282301 RepID=A0A1I8H1H3_9PLAT
MLTLFQSCCLACREVFNIDASSTTKSSGIFVSENFPHSLPVQSHCVYEFEIEFRNESDVLCIEFKQLEFYSANETYFLFGFKSEHDSFLNYAGNGSILWQRDDSDTFVFLRPESLYSGPICLRISDTINRYFLTVHNVEVLQPKLERVTLFLAEFATEDSRNLKPGQNSSSLIGRHRCLDGSEINSSKRCDSINDCSRPYSSDFFAGMSSDESYEYARCYSPGNFGTNFALGRTGAHSIQREDAWVDCKVDHSNHFSQKLDLRDCSLRVQRKSVEFAQRTRSPLRLSGFKAAAEAESATCYRFYWISNGFTTDNEALTLTESNGGRVLLRLPALWSLTTWSMAEVQLESGFSGGWIDVNIIQSDDGRNKSTGGAHWLDDLSAEPTECSNSAYESRMPFICSFEWSTCGWETVNLPVVTDFSVASEFGISSFLDHTSSSVPDRSVPRLPQRMLRLRPGSEDAVFLSNRRLGYSSQRCFELWFYGVGSNGFSFQMEVQISGTYPGHSMVVLTTTGPINQWNRMSGSVSSEAISSFTSVVLVVRANRWDKVHTVLLDDLSVTDGDCSNGVNGTLQCGSSEWRCSNGRECILSAKVCDGQTDCSDSSDEANCTEGGSSGQSEYWSFIVRVLIGLFVFATAFVALSTCLRQRWSSRSRARAPSSLCAVCHDGVGRPTAPDLFSDRTRRRPDMPPSYDEVAAGAFNSGFAADEEPPKYEEIIQVTEME